MSRGKTTIKRPTLVLNESPRFRLCPVSRENAGETRPERGRPMELQRSLGTQIDQVSLEAIKPAILKYGNETVMLNVRAK